MYHWVILFKTNEVYSAVIFITVIFVVISAGFVFFIIRFKVRQSLHHQEKKQMAEQFARQLLQSQIEVQEDTMHTLGQELHDNICQQLTSTKLMAAYAQRKPEAVTGTLTEIEGQLGQTIQDIRELTRSLDRDWLAQFDVMANLQAEIARINAAGVLAVTMTEPIGLAISNDRQVLLFRIIQEALQNALRHSGATAIAISISQKEAILEVIIRDNGRGFQAKSNPGLGMRNMRDRAGLLKGHIEWDSSPDGASVNIQIPIDKI